MSIVHIGYHKTGTTFLQSEVFPFFEGVEYINYHECEKKFKDIYSRTSFEFKSYNVEEFGLRPKSLYSFEGLVGAMGIGTYNYEIAKRLKAIGFEKIIITIRKQDEMVESIYRQYIQQGGVLSASKFTQDTDYFRWSYLDYYDLIECYSDIFGIENILIITQEELKKSLTSVLGKLQKFCGSTKIEMRSSPKKKNISLSFGSIKLLRIINHFTYNTYRRSNLISKKITTWKFRNIFQSILDPYLITKIFPKRYFYKEDFKKTVMQNFYNSNLKLSRKYNLKLEKYGYLE